MTITIKETNTKPENKLLDFLTKIPQAIGTPVSLLIHTIFFVLIFSLPLFGFDSQSVNIFFTTILSLEAIYLAIFIQMSVNLSNQNIQDISEDIDDLSEDIDDLSEDIEEIQGDIDYMTDEDEMLDTTTSHHFNMTQQIELLQKQIHAMSGMIDKMKDEVKK